MPRNDPSVQLVTFTVKGLLVASKRTELVPSVCRAVKAQVIVPSLQVISAVEAFWPLIEKASVSLSEGSPPASVSLVSEGVEDRPPTHNWNGLPAATCTEPVAAVSPLLRQASAGAPA